MLDSLNAWMRLPPTQRRLLLATLDDEELAELEALVAAEFDELVRAAAAAAPPVLALQPKQQLAEDLAGQAVELLYGGAAGGGKTFWLIDHARRQMELYPGNRGVIFRREFPGLRRTVLPRALAVFAGRAVWNGNAKTFTFPNGSVLELGSLQHEKDVYKYAGPEYGFIGFEELTEFLESQVDYMLSRLRAPVAGVRPHMAATTNPGGVGHRWVKRRYVRPKADDVDPEGPEPEPFVVWRPKPTDERPRPLTRCFVPALLEDNPALMERDPDYEDKIAAISNRGLRRALRTGDWDAIDAVEGALVLQSWLDGGRIAPKHAPAVVRRGICVDPSDGNETGAEFGIAGGFLAEDGRIYVTHSSGIRMPQPRSMAQRAINLYYETRSDFLGVEKNFGGKWLIQVFRDVDPDVNLVIVDASDGKKKRAEPALALFEPPDEKFLTRGGRIRAMERARRGRDNPVREGATPYARARLAGHYEELEDQLTSWTGADGEESPDRLDALVWLITELAGLSKSSAEANVGTITDSRLAGRRSR